MSDDDNNGLMIELPPPDPPKVTPLHPDDERAIKLVVDNTGKFCTHTHIVYHTYARKVTCGNCEAQLDPFDAMLKIIRDWENQADHYKWVKRELNVAKARLAELKRLEGNTRARLRRRGIKAPNVWELNREISQKARDGREKAE